jgi:hypothetical protein
MDFDDAIAAHTKWKVRLRTFLGGNGEPLDPATVARDNQCDLGKWIYGEGARYASLPAYEQLKTAHAKFHRCASQVVSAAKQGRAAEAQAMLEAGGEFGRLSSDTVTAIMQMKRAAAKQTA